MSATVITGRFSAERLVPPEATSSRESTKKWSDANVLTSWAQVHALLSWSRIPWIRHVLGEFKWGKEIFRDFFENLFRLQAVSIRSDEPDITLASIMEVFDPETWGRWQLGVDVFMKYLPLPPWALSDTELTGYISKLMDIASIDIALSLDDSDEYLDPKISKLSEIVGFAPENLPLYVLEWKKMTLGHDIATQIQEFENAVYISYEHFTEKQTDMKLIHMMTAFMMKALSQGYSPLYEGVIEISAYNDKEKSTGTIVLSFRELCEEVDNAILRKWPLYANYSDKTLVRNIVYDKYIAPYLISDEIEDEEEAGE